MTTHAQHVGALASDVQETEAKYLLHGTDRHNPRVTPWMPYQPADFIGIIWECMPQITPQEQDSHYAPGFLDVGCGPGTKMAIAASLFGLVVSGIEIDSAMALEAAKYLASIPTAEVEEGDALHVPEGYYGNFDLIWLYRPFRDANLERALEARIIDEMRSGAILAGGSWETDLAALGWQAIVDDTLIAPDGVACIWRGAWQKP